jgi:integrase
MASVRERSKGKWEIRAYVGLDPVSGNRQYVTTTVAANSRRAALTAARQFEARALTRRPGTTSMTFGEALDAWWDDKQRDLAPGTVSSYSNAMRHTAPLRKIPLGKLATRDLDRLYAALGKSGLSPSSVRKVHYVVANVLKQAKRHGLVSENVAQDAEPPKMIRRDVRPPTIDELAAILAEASRDPQLYTFLFVAATTGARRGELCGLRWRDVDLEQGTMAIRHNLAEDSVGNVTLKDTKSHRARTVPLDDATVQVLADHRERQAAIAVEVGSTLTAQRYVFSPRPGADVPFVPKVMTRRTTRLLTRLGLQDLNLHGLRHFVGSQLIASGADAETVRRRLGHARASTTLAIYTHAVTGNHDREAAATIGKIVMGATPTPD